jgi:hypothetical protein
MVRSVEHYASETIVVILATIRKAPVRVKSATIHDHELEVYEVHKVGNLTEHAPFTVYDAENINRDKGDDEDDDEEDSSFPESSSGDTPRASHDERRRPQKDFPNASHPQEVSLPSEDISRMSQSTSKSMYCP